MRREAGTRDQTRVLDIRLLGPITAELGGEPVSLGGPRQRAVLARLALVAGHVVTVDRLVDDVWPGGPPTTAVNTLQSYVSLLRRALGDANTLRREGPGYLLAVDRHALDVARFEDGVAEARRLGPGDEALALLDAALAEWRGPVMADVIDEEWARSAAVRWEELRMSALEARYDALLALGRHAEAVVELERTSDEYPLREGFARRLMIALYRSDRQADALRVFARSRAVLADELGLDPSPALVELQTAILNHDPNLKQRGPIRVSARESSPAAPAVEEAEAVAAAKGPPSSPVPLPGPVVRAGRTTFVGRQAHLGTLHRLWSEAVGGDRHLALLTGEAGAGKSRLAARFASDVHNMGGIVLWGRATQDAVVPFEPMVEALRTALRTVSPEAAARIARDRGILVLLLPELDHLVPGVRPERPDPSVERYLLFETVAELLHGESREHPLLIVLDDVQWADAPSLKMIEHVIRHELTSRMMTVMTVRAPADDPTPELDRVAATLARDDLLTRIAVDALGTGEVGTLLELHGQEAIGAAELRAATGGNAFFLTELIRHAAGEPGADLPDSVRDMLGVRLDRLDPVVMQVLNLTAVAGQAATLPVLVAASGLDGDRLLDATDHAVSAGLLVEDGAGRLAMPHALIGQVIDERLGRTRRLDLHRRLGEALEQDSEPNSSPARHAHHLMAAGGLIDRHRRIAAGLAAGQHSLSIAAYEDAAMWARRSGELVVEETEIGDRVAVKLLESEVARAIGDGASAMAAAKEAAALARLGEDPSLVARAAETWVMSLSGVGFDIGRPADPQLVELMELAIATLPDSDRRYQVRMRSMLSSVLVASHDATRREQLATEALAIAAADGSPELLASAHLAQRLALWQLDRLDERAEVAMTAVREAGRTTNVQLQLTAKLFALADLLELGRIEDHLAMLGEFRAQAADAHLALFDVYGMFLEVSRLVSIGRYDEAQKLADEARATGLRSHGENAEVAYAGFAYRVAMDRGRLASLLPDIERLVAIRPLRTWQISRLRILTEVPDRRADAEQLLAEFVDADRVRIGQNQMFLPAAAALVEVTHALGDAERAAALADALSPYLGRVAVAGLAGFSVGPVSGYVGLAALTAGDLESAERFLRQAIEENVAQGTRPYEARARRDLAATLRARGGPGDAGEAARHAAEARDIAADIGLTL